MFVRTKCGPNKNNISVKSEEASVWKISFEQKKDILHYKSK